MKKIIIGAAILLMAQGVMAADMKVATILQTKTPEIRANASLQIGCFQISAPGQSGFYVNRIKLYSDKDPAQYFSKIKLVSTVNGQQIVLGEVPAGDVEKVKDNSYNLNFPKMSLPVARGQYKNICLVATGAKEITTATNFNFWILKNGIRNSDARNLSGYSTTQVGPLKIKLLASKVVSATPAQTPAQTTKPATPTPPFYSVTSETKVNHNLAVSDTADASIQVQLTAKGGDIYIPTTGAVSARALRVDWTETSSTMAYSMSTDMQGDNYVLHDGDTKAMTVLVHIEPYATGYYYSQVDSIGWKNEPNASTLNLLNYSGISQEYKSSQVYLIKR